MLFRSLALLSSAVIAALVLGGALIMVDSRAEQPRVYAAPAVLAALAHAGQQWQGRTMLVRGRLVGCPYTRPGECASWQPLLTAAHIDPMPATSGLPVVLQWQPMHALPVLLRHIPVLGALLPTSQVLHWGTVATYRIQFQHVASPAPNVTAYEAVLVDAAP